MSRQLKKSRSNQPAAQKNPVPDWAIATLETINGARGLMMLGAKHVTYDPKSYTVNMKLPKNASGGNYLSIRYNRGKDLYDVRIEAIRNTKKGFSRKVKAELEDAYGDMIAPFVEQATGMYLSMGTMRRNPSSKKNPKAKRYYANAAYAWKDEFGYPHYTAYTLIETNSKTQALNAARHHVKSYSDHEVTVYDRRKKDKDGDLAIVWKHKA